MLKVSKRLLSASHRPDKVVDRLNVEADTAEVEVQGPGVIGAVRVGRGRPVVAGLHAGERMARGQWRFILTIVDQALQLLDVGQAPSALRRAIRKTTLAGVQRVGRRQCISPNLSIEAIGILQPDQPSEVVGNGAVPVIGETGIGSGHALL